MGLFLDYCKLVKILSFRVIFLGFVTVVFDCTPVRLFLLKFNMNQITRNML